MGNTITKQRQSDFYYFGCRDTLEKGHYLFLPRGKSAPYECWGDLPSEWQHKVDGTLCPKGQEIQGKALIRHCGGWTSLAFWDRSVDSRPGSNSVFLAFGTFGFAEMLRIASEQFPEVLSRFSYSIFEAEQ